MNDAYDADVQKVARVQFSLMNPNDIRRRSVVEVTKERIYDGGGIPCPAGLFDRKMGVLESGVTCTTDDLDKQESPGYFGHIELAMPVFYVQFVPWIKGTLECVCFRCGALRLHKDLRQKQVNEIRGLTSNATRYTRLTKLIKEDRTNTSICPQCSARQPDKILYEKEDLQFIAEWTRASEDTSTNDKTTQQSRVLMTPEYVQMLFKRLPDEDSLLLGFNPQFSRPEWMICSVLPVAPPSVRPSVKKEGQQPRSEDDLTHKYIDIIKCNKMLKQKLSVLAQQQLKAHEEHATGGGGEAEEQVQIHSRMVESWRYILQYHVATLIDNECGVNQAQQRSGRPLKAIRQRLKSKEGRIRGNLMGKRVDFSARTVITPDPLLKLDELGVPMDMCINMTVPERVNPFNMERLRKMVRNGSDKFPGARIVEKANGRRLSLKFFTADHHRHLLEEKAQGLQVGDVVHRHLQENDHVLFNRQPSLHKMSMMCHRVKPMDIGKTFRLSVDATSPYNADFDGDEMNMHVPQSMEAATELQSLAAVHKQLIGPAEAKPCINPVQDTMLGAYLLSKETTRAFDRRHFMNALLWTSKTWRDLSQRKKLPPTEQVNGVQTYSAIMPDKLSVSVKKIDDVVVENGTFVKGTLNKKVFSAPSNGLIHATYQDCGATAARDLIDDVRGMVTAYMYHRGFSVGLSDLVVSDEVKANVQQVIADVHHTVEADMQKLYQGTLDNPTRLRKSALVEQMTMGKAKKITSTAATEIQKMDGCRFKDMMTAGSKGNEINLAQMIGCLGQQVIEGARATYSFQDRTLPHFCKYDDSLEARGFVDNSYLNGLTPHEFFFHAMGGRVGLIDTAVKTAQTGYIQRKLVKSMEDLRVENDETVRGANGRIVNLLFGEDGMDSSQLEAQKVPFATHEGTLVRDYLGKGTPSAADVKAFLTRFFAPSTPTDTAMLTHQLSTTMPEPTPPDTFAGLPVVNYYRDVVCAGCYSNNAKKYDCSTVKYPVHLQRIVRNVQAQHKAPANASPVSFHDGMAQIDTMLDAMAFAKDTDTTSINPATQLFRVLLYGTLLRVETRKSLPQPLFKHVLDTVQHVFYNAKVHAGEMVGVVAAQSIGEPATQMTLNTFHLAGVGEKSKVTQGVPRLKEILTLTKNPKTASLQIFLKPECQNKVDAENVKNTLEITRLRDVTKGTSIYYDPALDRFGTTLESDAQMLQYLDALHTNAFTEDSATPDSDEPANNANHWVVRVALDREQMFSRNLRMEDIYHAMKALHGEDIEVEYSDDNAENLLVRVRVCNYSENTDQMDDFYLLKMLETNLLDNVVLRGVPLIQNVRVDTEQATASTYVLDAATKQYVHKDVKHPVLHAEGTKEGTNLHEILTHPAVDATRTLSDHLTEVHEVLGIEAVRELILRELTNVISSSGNDPPSKRHMMLLADTMTAQGSTLISIDRNGIKRSDIGPLARCSFEESDKQLYQAAIFGECDDVDGVSANIMLGQVPPCGTGMIQVLFDEEEFVRIQKDFKGNDGATWAQHVCQWERDMQGMGEVQSDIQAYEADDDVMPTIDEDDYADDEQQGGNAEATLSYDMGMEFEMSEAFLDEGV